MRTLNLFCSATGKHGRFLNTEVTECKWYFRKVKLAMGYRIDTQQKVTVGRDQFVDDFWCQDQW